jgi:hypothetical protein
MLPPVDDVHNFFNFINAVLLGIGDIALRAIGLLTIIRFDWKRLTGHGHAKMRKKDRRVESKKEGGGEENMPEDRNDDDPGKPHAA